MQPYHKHKQSRFKEQFKTLNDTFDMSTEETLWKLISEGYIDGLESPLSIGKEANVFTAVANDEKRVVKIYRVMTCDFRRMYSHIASDPRFPGLHKSRKHIVEAWCQREYRNLLKAREAGCRVPIPFVARQNVLIMESIGGDTPAQKLNQSTPNDMQNFFSLVVKNMRKLNTAKLVHGDLSQFNILNDDEMPVLIDFSQSTTTENPMFDNYFDRDIRNITGYFAKKGIKITEKELREKIVGK